MTRKEFLSRVIRSREHLMKRSKSKRSNLQCAQIIKRLKRQMDAYGNKWTSEGWRKFLERNREDIAFIIPGNNSYTTQLETLNNLING